MKELFIVKIGGNIVDNPTVLNQFLRDFAKVDTPKILIHGGGKIATETAQKLGVETQMVEGRRITNRAMLDVATMVYAGLVNKNIVAQWQSADCQALGVTGADLNLISAHKRPVKEIDYGFVGDIDAVNVAQIDYLLQGGITLVFCALTHDQQGQLLNTNADTIASQIAVAMSQLYKTSLLFGFEKKGVLRDVHDENSVILTINTTEYQTLKSEGAIYAGMIPKLDNAFQALEAGVSKIIIGQAEMLGAGGTSLSLLTPEGGINSPLLWRGVGGEANSLPFGEGWGRASESKALLCALISIPSFSKEEDKTGDLIEHFLREKGYNPERRMNNIWVKNRLFDDDKPTILLNSHHDTVKPTQGYTLNPFEPIVQDGKLYGLGSNDAGASLVSMLAVFLHLDSLPDLPYNLIYSATAEEEISGKNGVESILVKLPKIDLGIVGEPTQMQMAIAEKGLLVLDCVAKGSAGHAAREEGENALYKAMQDIAWIQGFEFPKISPLLGKVKTTVTQIEAGYQHNIVPDVCRFVIDVRTNELYSNQEAYEILKNALQSEVTPRSFRLNSSKIDLKHPIVRRGMELGLTYYGSPTSSDQAVMPFTTIKIGVGDSARSHTADEFVYLHEIEQGIEIYIQLLQGLKI